MKRLLAVLVFSVATQALAQSGPSFHQAEPDLAMLLARRAPLTLQPALLMVLDTALPMAAGLAGAGIGCATGGALFVASGRAPFALAAWPVRDTFLTYTAVGALAGGTVGMFAADLALNTRHLGRVLPARLAWTALMVPAPLLLSLTTVTQGYSTLPPWASVSAVAVARVVWLFSWGCLPPAALALSAWTRAKMDDRQGSALWEEDESAR